MSYRIIDTHSHLWEELRGEVEGYPVRSLGGGRATFYGGIKQMMPPYMTDGRNTVEMFLSNMDYAGVSGAVVTQEYIDGEQNGYLLSVKQKYPQRFKICGLAEFREPGFLPQVEKLIEQGFDGIKIPAQRLVPLPERVYLTNPEMMQCFALMEKNNVILSIDLAEGDAQTGEMEEVIQAHPGLKVAIGHFGMANRPKWKNQIQLARYENVRIESGGITWLYHNEFYPYRGAVRAIKEAAEMVGMEKLMWGSDYPRTMTAITYKMSFDFVAATEELTSKEKALFLGENAFQFYGFCELPGAEAIKNMVED